jgi:alpha-L-rhamnosidase
MMIASDLRCEYAHNPLGIDATRPRLSWVLSAARRNQQQQAYQVLAASSPEQLAAATPDLWDSGIVPSADTLVEYGGPLLESRRRVWWKVRAWNRDGQAGPFSEPAWFEMALLHPGDWRADWIGYPGAWPGKALYFCRDFQIEKPVERARVYMVGLGWSELYVNGQKANDRVLDPPQSNYARRVLYSTDAVENLLRAGSNTIGVVCGNGWYGTIRLLLQMEITYTDGARDTIVSETMHPAPWLVSTGPVLENSVYDGEVYDARLEDPGWASPERAPKNRLVAACADGPGGRRGAACLEPIRVVETLTAKAITQPQPGVYVVDLGQNIAGWALLRVRGEGGTRISLRFAETLYPDGSINQENLRNACAEDVYILKGAEEETWEPRFTYHGFRYIQVTGYPGPLTAEAVVGRVVRTAAEVTGQFECSSPLLNRIQDMVRWTEAGNLHSLPTDCPQRDERMGWLNDMAARSEEAVYNFDLVRLLSKWVADIHDEQDPATGAITDTAPFRWGRRPADPVSVCYLLIPWLLYVHYGDTHTMAEHFEGMRAWVDYLTSRAEDHIVTYSYYGDWAPPITFGLQGSQGSSAFSKDTPGALVSTACYAYSAALLARMAAVLGRQAEASHYETLAGYINQRFNACFFCEASGGYGINNQSSNAIALYMGLVPAERRTRVADNLAANVLELNDGHLTTGNICTKYLLEALTAQGRASVALRIAQQESYPSWGYMLANGATTLWERWEKATGGGMNSHNHPMLGSVSAWFYRALAGIQAAPEGPGFACFELRPQIDGGLTYARAVLKTVRGTIRSAWRIEGKVLYLSLSVPVGSQARLYLPQPPGARLAEGERLLWANETPLGDGLDGLELRRKGEYLVIGLGSGDYEFQTTRPKGIS